ncbi:MAG: hypothetical protein ACUVWX_10210 [Kiritimatiellia bacterium]
MQEFLVKTISELVAIPSLSGEEQKVADYVYGHLSAVGLQPQRDEEDNVWVMVGPGEEPLLHVNSHMDTVVPMEGWRTDPFRPVVRGICSSGWVPLIVRPA